MAVTRFIVRCSAAALLALSLVGCATTKPAEPGVVYDPLEPFNRSVFSFNDALDSALVKPAAKAYEKVVPGLFRGMIGNFFGNLADIWTSANQLLQGKPALAASDLSRVVVNTTFGFFGIADVASEMGLEKHNEDFGQTLGVWGVGSGPYLVLPFFGPSNFRDGPSLVVDWSADPVVYGTDSMSVRNSLVVTRALDTRARLFPAERVLEGAALDKYDFVRDASQQRRLNQIYDGNPPLPADDE